MSTSTDLITVIENSIVGQLNCAEIGARIDNDPRANQVNPKARVTVQFLEDDAVSRGDRSKSSQPLSLRFTITTELTDQRIGSHQNAYPILAAIKQSLIGFQPEQGDRIRYVGTQRQDIPTESGIYWQYVTTISTNAIWAKQ